MVVTKTSALCLALIAFASASPITPSVSDAQPERRLLANPYTLPNHSPDPLLRKTGITTKRATFLYGPGIGGGPYSPTGALGATYITTASAIVDPELAAEEVLTTSDTTLAIADTPRYDGLKTLDDYVKLYDGEWVRTLAPTGVCPGLLTNYTQDLLFSMERLSFNPYAVSRLTPSSGSLPFTVSDTTVQKITGETLESLYKGGRLFLIDYSAQGKLPRVANQYVGAPQAYFYISNTSEFMPLAIRTGVGKNLIYTPADSADDWLLAKMMFNANDFFFGQFHHLANTHFVVEIAYQAAVRTLSQDHPIMAVLDRLMSGAFGIRPLAVAILFPPGGDVDRYFGYTGTAAQDYAGDLYDSGYAGNFQSNYFMANLERRGLINSPIGPPLKDFPFYEDASAIYAIIYQFMTTFVNSYYTSDAAIAQDSELQAWLVEANGPAKAMDFPTKSQLTTRAELINMLTHFGHLVSTAHHAVNLNQLETGSGVLPFHPSALFKPMPAAKGVQDVASFLAPINKALGSINGQAAFSRPGLANSARTLSNMFNDPVMLSRMNTQTRAANTKFMSAMKARSQVVSSRTFDSQGLSQGMPFVWKALDPEVIPFTLTI